jgi:alcohol oxidase
MMYVRAAASDYDDWEKLGNPGWGSVDLIPLAKKVSVFRNTAQHMNRRSAA